MRKHTWRHDARVIMPSSQRCLWVFQYNAKTCLRGEKRKGSLPHPAPSMELRCGLRIGKTVRHFSVGRCTMLSGSRREEGLKCQGTQSDCPTEYLGITCSDLCILRCSAKGFSRTVQLNTLASRETSSAQRQSMSSSAFSRSLDSGRLRDERHNFHITFAASKYYHSNDISVTERVNIDKIESQTNWTARFQSA